MAKFWEHLKYHKDTTEKHEITAEEIEFLRKLQKEMNTQDNVGQADPRYWVIRDYETIYGESLNSADGIVIYDSEQCHTVYKLEYSAFDIDSVINEIIQEMKENEYELLTEEIEEIKLAYDVESLKEYLKDLRGYEFSVMEYQDIPKDKGFFFTQKSAEDHLRRNYYHYSAAAHTYAHTAWRSQEEKLWNILREVDFEKIKGKCEHESRSKRMC